jgi:hypothetical protein
MDTFGQPGFVPSNRTGVSGISGAQVGSLGSGILQTIEEGEGAKSSENFYYTKDSAYYQLPQLQRSHGDARITCNVTTFGSRGTVTLPRRFFNFGPCIMRFQLPISYAWSGCEYTARSFMSDETCQSTIYYTNADHSAVAIGNATEIIPEFLPASFNHRLANGISFVEVPGCKTLLPTSFQSGGMAFTFPQQIELEMGGAGKITFDRYSNFAAIMASTPFKSMRKDLMRMAGGGLDLWDTKETQNAPVRWGYVDGYNAAGNQEACILTGAAETATVQQRRIREWVPVSWDVLLPIKTPDTNFFMSFSRRKPLDTTCFSGDFQLTFTWSNFYEWSDTGTGYPNAPVYKSQAVPTPFVRAYAAAGNCLQVAPYITGLATYLVYAADENARYVSSTIGTGYRQLRSTFEDDGDGTAAGHIWDIEHPDSQKHLSNVMLANPRIWTNHYRVAQGRSMTDDDQSIVRSQWTTGNSNDQAVTNVPRPGRPRFPQLYSQGVGAPATTHETAIHKKVYLSNQPAADVVNAQIQYPSGFDFVEYINSSLKLANPSLSAYNALRVDKSAVVYYPFQYFYSQVYRIAQTPYTNITNWNSSTITNERVYGKDAIYSDQNKITQSIQMPANPVTSMIVGIYREKDRKYLGKNPANSYSPVLFWNALTLAKCTLWDGGNILFNYDASCDYDLYSMNDRPDILRIPFKGGLCKVSPKGFYSSDSLSCMSSRWNATVNRDVKGVDSDYASLTQHAPWLGVSATLSNTYVPVTIGYTGSNCPATSQNSYPADDIVCSGLMDPLLGKQQPCHLTDDYEAVLYEFPFVMYNPVLYEKNVQSTPSFARTQLRFEFWIYPKLKPDNGLDDMYDSTYSLTYAAASGLGMFDITSASEFTAVASFPGPISHPVPDCMRVGMNPDHPELARRSEIAQSVSTSGKSTSLTAFTYAQGYSFLNANSWNINNGALMMHVVFCQNQVWSLSPIRTSILAARA